MFAARRLLRPAAAQAVRALSAAAPRAAPAFPAAAAAAAAVAAASAAAGTAALCEYVEPTTSSAFPDAEKGLAFCGAGVRIKFGFVKVYAVGLYAGATSGGAVEYGLSKGSSVADAAKVLCATPLPKVLRLVLARDIDAKTFAAAITDAVEPRMAGADAPQLAKFRTMRPDGNMPKGTVVSMHIDGAKLTLEVDGKSYGTVESAKLTWALADVYFGATPISEPAKKAMCEGLIARC